MALITRQCTSKGASVTFTINDATLRVTMALASALARQMRIVLFDAQGRSAQEIAPALNTVSSVILDFPARLVEIEKSDQTIKSYLCPPFAVYF